MKYSQFIGVAAAIGLMLSAFLHWAWYPDLQEYFTGYYTHGNTYGRPGRVFVVVGIVAIIFFVTPRIWAKRWNVFLCAILLAFAIKTLILFSGCYRGVCPVRQPGIWIMLAMAALMMLSSLLPDLKMNQKRN